jgi:hypothetical protein
MLSNKDLKTKWEQKLKFLLDNLWNALSNECPMTQKVPTLSILWTQIQTSRTKQETESRKQPKI